MAEAFAKAGYFFVKFNFSHNGTTIDDPDNFGDLEAFGKIIIQKSYPIIRKLSIILKIILKWILIRLLLWDTVEVVVILFCRRKGILKLKH